MNKYTTLSNEALLRELKSELERHSVQSDIEPMKKYMKGMFDYFGVKSQARKEAARATFNNFGRPEPGNYRAFCKLCWNADQRELQYVAMNLVPGYRSAWNENEADFFEFLIQNKSWWDTVDFIASNITGLFFKKFPGEIENRIPEWITSPDMWLNRTAILFQLKYGDNTDFELLKRTIEPHRHSKEFFHQKAIGWALRQYAKTNPKAILQYVRSVELKPLSYREATKHLQV